MGTDRAAIAFAKWLEAHKRHVEAERRLSIARRTTSQIGTSPPQQLFDEVRALKAEADRLLAAAQAELNRE
jgi:hypothetical protein